VNSGSPSMEEVQSIPPSYHPSMMYQPPLTISSYPRAIVHVEGGAFFASCEQARHSKLRGLPSERAVSGPRTPLLGSTTGLRRMTTQGRARGAGCWAGVRPVSLGHIRCSGGSVSFPGRLINRGRKGALTKGSVFFRAHRRLMCFSG
jgi:hypothetical protein